MQKHHNKKHVEWEHVGTKPPKPPTGTKKATSLDRSSAGNLGQDTPRGRHHFWRSSHGNFRHLSLSVSVGAFPQLFQQLAEDIGSVGEAAVGRPAFV